ncbi:MAG: hypothetical protein FJ290_23935 [Planctomycetes bacterium]|nr:hypothetical protein [Planctomycetota bacterium]
MTTISVPARARSLNSLFRKARRRSVMLESHDGHRFILAPADGWEAFEVGEDWTENKKLMKFLTERRSGGRRVPLEEVEAKLGLR